MAQPYHGAPLGRQIPQQPFSLGCYHDPSIPGALHPLVLARIHRHAAHLQALGPRAVAEALTEFAKGLHGPAEVLGVLGRYGRLTPAQIAAAGADRPLPRQLVAVPRPGQ